MNHSKFQTLRRRIIGYLATAVAKTEKIIINLVIAVKLTGAYAIAQIRTVKPTPFKAGIFKSKFNRFKGNIYIRPSTPTGAPFKTFLTKVKLKSTASKAKNMSYSSKSNIDQKVNISESSVFPVDAQVSGYFTRFRIAVGSMLKTPIRFLTKNEQKLNGNIDVIGSSAISADSIEIQSGIQALSANVLSKALPKLYLVGEVNKIDASFSFVPLYEFDFEVQNNVDGKTTFTFTGVKPLKIDPSDTPLGANNKTDIKVSSLELKRILETRFGQEVDFESTVSLTRFTEMLASLSYSTNLDAEMSLLSLTDIPTNKFDTTTISSDALISLLTNSYIGKITTDGDVGLMFDLSRIVTLETETHECAVCALTAHAKLAKNAYLSSYYNSTLGDLSNKTLSDMQYIFI